MDESLVDSKYLRHLFKYLDNPPEPVGVRGHKPTYKLECPLCGAKKATMVWSPQLGTYKFFCSKTNRRACGISCQFPVLLKVWNQPLYLMYLDERQAEGTAGAGWNVPKSSLVNPKRRSKRQLDWRTSQVPDQPRTDPEDPDGGAP